MSLSNPTISPFFSNVTPISISRVEDLEGKSKEEIWCIFCGLAANNAALASTIAQLNGVIIRKDEEINILRGELSDIATLKKKVATLLDENNNLIKRIENLENQLATIKQGLSAREIGSQADTIAMKRVFPDSTKKPFSLRSLANLAAFIANPVNATENSLCPPGAVEAWNAMEDVERNTIKSKLDELLKTFPALLFSIKTLKDNWKIAHTITSVSEAIGHFRELGDETMVEAIELCAILLVKV